MIATAPYRSWCVLALLVFAGGCSTFDRDWNSLSLTKAPTPASGILGRWEGRWRSQESNHDGQLRCIVAQLPEKPGRAASAAEPGAKGALYECRFHALWGWDFVSEYTVELEVREEAGRYSFKGESDLGMFFGKYRCEGNIVGDRFFANYEAAGDRGTFEMKRAGSAK